MRLFLIISDSKIKSWIIAKIENILNQINGSDRQSPIGINKKGNSPSFRF